MCIRDRHWGLLPQEVDAFALMAQRNDRHMEQLSLLAGHPTRTADGTPVKLFANGQDALSCKEINRFGCDGIGSVSYTHLDVYKRQGGKRSEFIHRLTIFKAESTN